MAIDILQVLQDRYGFGKKCQLEFRTRTIEGYFVFSRSWFTGGEVECRVTPGDGFPYTYFATVVQRQDHVVIKLPYPRVASWFRVMHLDFCDPQFFDILYGTLERYGLLVSYVRDRNRPRRFFNP